MKPRRNLISYVLKGYNRINPILESRDHILFFPKFVQEMGNSQEGIFEIYSDIFK
jgi:hypothetical protein